MENSLITYLAHYFVLFPIVKILFVNIQYFTNKQERQEYMMRKLVHWGNICDFIHVAIALYFLGFSEVTVQIESFCFLGWPFVVHWNLLTFIFLAFTTTIIAIIGHFSLFYLHRDAYYHKFFSLYFIFHLSIKLIVLSSGSTFFFMGWELLGFSSVLLIAFYEHRSNPLKNAMRVLFIYEFGDVFLLALVALMLFFHTEDITKLALILEKNGCEWAMVLLILACFFKSGIFPWIWLPRAMEGPTPSSAVFYGSLSTHIPIFLLLRFWPKEWSLPAYWPEVWSISHPANAIAVAIAICVFSAFVTTHLSRQHSDAKNTIAYATITQLAVIYIEIFLGFHTLALVHVVSHGIYRTFEFLRTPSLLHLYHTMETRRPRMTHTGKHFKALLPEGLRNWLYSLTINEFGFFSRSFDFIDQFLGLKFLRFDKKAARRFTLMITVVWTVFSIIIFLLNRNLFTVECTGDGGNTVTAFIVNWKYFNAKDEILLALAVGFTVLTFYNIRKVGMFFVTLTCSAATVGIEHTLLLVRHTDASNLLYWISVIVLAVAFAGLAFYSVYAFSNGRENYSSYTAKLSRTTLANLLLFIAGLAIVGVPGLGIVLAWEYLIHYTAQVAPYMVVKGFFIIKLDTLLVFLFYFSNFLGFPEHKVQMLHHYKLDTLHLRWAQKHS